MDVERGLTNVATLDLFDASCMVGRTGVRQPGAPTSASELVETLQSFGIASALVYHADAAASDFQRGNRRLLDDIAAHPNLHPCWVLVPHQTGEMPAPEAVVPMMLAAGVRATRLFPRDHRFALRGWNIGPLLERLAHHQLPVWLDFGLRGWTDDVIDWDGIDEVCTAFPSLPLVLVGANIGSNRRLFPLMERHPNLLIETSYYTVHRGIELVTRTFGAERLLFGTGFPVRAPGPAITALTYSSIDDRERACVGGGNLRALLAGVQP